MAISAELETFLDRIHDDARLRYSFETDPESSLAATDLPAYEKRLLVSRDQDLLAGMKSSTQPITNTCVVCVVVAVVKSE